MLGKHLASDGHLRPIPVPSAPTFRMNISWKSVGLLGLVALYLVRSGTAETGASDSPPPIAVPADFVVPPNFPAAVRALETLVGNRAVQLTVLDSMGLSRRTHGASVGVPTEQADSFIADAQRAFRDKGFLLFRHEPHYGINGRPDEIALLPIRDQYDAVRLVGTNGANFDLRTGAVVNWLRELERDAPFVLTGIGYDHVEGRFLSPLADPDAVAERLYAFCPDIVNQGTGSVRELAIELRRLNTFFCWWD